MSEKKDIVRNELAVSRKKEMKDGWRLHADDGWKNEGRRVRVAERVNFMFI